VKALAWGGRWSGDARGPGSPGADDYALIPGHGARSDAPADGRCSGRVRARGPDGATRAPQGFEAPRLGFAFVQSVSVSAVAPSPDEGIGAPST
jgi:hypothetical protein